MFGNTPQKKTTTYKNQSIDSYGKSIDWFSHDARSHWEVFSTDLIKQFQRNRLLMYVHTWLNFLYQKEFCNFFLNVILLQHLPITLNLSILGGLCFSQQHVYIYEISYLFH